MKDERGWTLNSVGYNRGFDQVLKRLMDYKVPALMVLIEIFILIVYYELLKLILKYVDIYFQDACEAFG